MRVPPPSVSTTVDQPPNGALVGRTPDLEVMAESIPHFVWTAKADGAVTYFNRQASDYTGVPPEDGFDWKWAGFVHPDDFEGLVLAWDAARDGHVDYSHEVRVRRYDRKYRWHSIRALPLRDARGAIESWLGTATDIDDQKRLEQQLRAAEQRASQTLALLESIESAAPVGLLLVDQHLRIVHVNETMAARLPDPHDRLSTRHWLASYFPLCVDGEVTGVGSVLVDITSRKHSEQVLSKTLTAVINTIAATVEHRDPYTAGHQRRVADLAGAIAVELGHDVHTVEGIAMAASIHDLGKISVPAEILSKPGRLSSPQFELIKEHPRTGYDIVRGIDFPWPVAEMILQHHERLDGSGYPRGLSGDDIIFGARIIAVADVAEAMTAHRPYRPGLGLDAALAQLAHDRDVLLDADAVEACLRLFRSERFRFDTDGG